MVVGLSASQKVFTFPCFNYKNRFAISYKQKEISDSGGIRKKTASFRITLDFIQNENTRI